jgi:RelA/SpoT family (p)ppGpp synthetase
MSYVRKYPEDIDPELVTKAFYYCVNAHKGMARASGQPFYVHPLEVAVSLIDEFQTADTASVVASLLHDTIEDVKGITDKTIGEEFNPEIAGIIDALTKMNHDKTSALDNKALTYRKLFLALVKDIRVILIKLADRLHNMRTLHFLKSQKQKQIALETLNFYIPFAHRLGLTRIKMELENRSFFYSDPAAYEAIRSALNEKRRSFIDYIRMFSDHIQNSLNENNVPHTLTIVHKHEYEIFKMIQDGMSITDIDNFYSMVIVLESNNVIECYRAHGVLANAFNTVSRFVDYIANPKIDWYKSLNTELIGPDGKRVEILIRTQEMEKIAEEGIAAHFSLKEGRTRALEFDQEEIEQWGEWMQEIIEEKGEEASQIIWDSLKVNLFDKEVVVFSESGRQIKLPDGATPIDFAFALSDEKGLHFIAAKVNGVMVKEPYKYRLKSGDQVSIISSKNLRPDPAWMDHVVSHRAVVKLNNFFKNHPPKFPRIDDREENLEIILKIIGEDREGMLFKITEAIGQANISRIKLDASDSIFEGAIKIKVKDMDHLNTLFAMLMNIEGVRSVEQIKDGATYF